MSQVTVSKWGRSLAIRLPGEIVKAAELSNGADVTGRAKKVPTASLSTEWQLEVESWQQADGSDPTGAEAGAPSRSSGGSRGGAVHRQTAVDTAWPPPADGAPVW